MKNIGYSSRKKRDLSPPTNWNANQERMRAAQTGSDRRMTPISTLPSFILITGAFVMVPEESSVEGFLSQYEFSNQVG